MGDIVRELIMKPFVLVLFLTAWITTAAELDTGGNGFLRGDYFVRQVIASDVNNTIDIGQMRSVYGTMTFDGNGSYQFRGSVADSRTAGGRSAAMPSACRRLSGLRS